MVGSSSQNVLQLVKSNCAQPPSPSQATMGHLHPGDGALANFAWPGGRAFAYSGATPELLTHVVSYPNTTKHGGF